MSNYTINEKIQHHLDKAKVGAVDRNGKPLSDFVRGRHAQKAQQLIAKKDRWIETHRDQIPKSDLKKHDDAKKRRKQQQEAYRRNMGGNK